MYEAILANFAHYNVAELMTLLVTPSFYATIAMLICLEVTLSADNAIVLAILVKPLPEAQQKKALKYGILGAYAFRFVAIGLGTLLVKLWWIKAIGGAYLLKLAIEHFYLKFFGEDKNENDVPDEIEDPWIVRLFRKCGLHISPLVQCIIAVELMDIAFSADSVLAAFGVSNSVWVLLLGGMLGILAMRFAAQQFVKLLEKIPELETAAYVMIAFIGGKMVAAIEHFPIPYTNITLPGLGYEMNEWASFIAMVVCFAGAYVVNKVRSKA